MAAPIPISERPNPLTMGIDLATPDQMFQILNKVDRELFHGWPEVDQPFLTSETIIQTMQKVVDIAASSIVVDGLIVLSGCGTSGRLAWFTARNLNRFLVAHSLPPVFRYLIASGDKALIIGQELGEDDPRQGVADLQKLLTSESKQRILYVGITCGLSAPYVASQLDYLYQNYVKEKENPLVTSVLLGFNPNSLSRDVPIENWTETFRSAMRKIQSGSGDHFLLLNPIVGPEGITGSTRMKGGSATKIILDSIFRQAIAARLPTLAPKSLREVLQSYEDSVSEFYANEQIRNLSANLIQKAAHSLSNGGHLYYVSLSVPLGIVGLIDASECPPTYGASVYDVQGFVPGGWKDLNTRDGDLSLVSRPYEISTEFFCSDISPKLTLNDTVVLIHRSGDEKGSHFLELFHSISAKLSHTLASRHVVIVGSNPAESATIFHSLDSHPSFVEVSTMKVIENDPILFGSVVELSLKLLCNAITTGAHVLKGKVFENRMIDVRVSNNKLYHRAIAIVGKCGRVSETVARTNLLRAIHDEENLSLKSDQLPISTHIAVGSHKEKVVSKAILMSVNPTAYPDPAAAAAALHNEPIVGKHLKN